MDDIWYFRNIFFGTSATIVMIKSNSICTLYKLITKYSSHPRDRNWEVQAGSPDKIFDKKMSICLTKL
jgi:hypothetical protein